jgi:hypothetical protein
MDDSTPQDRHEYLGDADGAAGGASVFLDGDTLGGDEDLSNLRELDLRDLVRRVLADVEANLPYWGPVKGWPRRQANALEDSLPGEKAIPVRLSNGRSGWLEITEEGAFIFSRPLRSDQTILAALCTARMIPINSTSGRKPERLRHAAQAYVLLDSKGLAEPFDLSQILEAARSDPQIGSIAAPELFDAWKLRLHDALIRHYRPEYAAAPDEERIALLAQTAKRVDAMLSAIRELQTFLEEGDARGLSKHQPVADRYKGVDPQRDIRAAELKDALGLKALEIAEVLEFTVPEDYHTNKNIHLHSISTSGTYKIPAVTIAIERGRNLLRQALPNESEYENYMERIRPALRSWNEYWRMLLAAQKHHAE